MTIVQRIIALKNYTLQFKKTTLTIFFLMSLLIIINIKNNDKKEDNASKN